MTRHALDQRRADVHQQDGVRAPFRRGLLAETEYKQQQTAADTEYNLALARRRRRRIVRCHKERAENQTAGQHLIQRGIYIKARRQQVADRKRADKCNRNMPGNDLANKEVSRTNEQRQLAGLTERSGNVAQEQLRQRIIARKRRADRASQKRWRLHRRNCRTQAWRTCSSGSPKTTPESHGRRVPG